MGKNTKNILVAVNLCGSGYLWQLKQMVLLKLFNGFVKVVLCIFQSLSNKTKLSKLVEASALN